MNEKYKILKINVNEKGDNPYTNALRFFKELVKNGTYDDKLFYLFNLLSMPVEIAINVDEENKYWFRIDEKIDIYKTKDNLNKVLEMDYVQYFI